MSGSGFYRFRCKNFLTYNCENWVWVNHSACAQCVAAGRDNTDSELQTDDGHSASSVVLPCEIISPRRSAATASGLDFFHHLFSSEEEGEKEKDIAVAMLESRGFCDLDCGEDVPGSWETAVKVHPCCKH
ncbi:hypothetical protein DFP73DRAFT_569297 [Morchella snyderi]|nr:hypothetical protein DFP73DRAFT_569297 [Morchella snyderi]